MSLVEPVTRIILEWIRGPSPLDIRLDGHIRIVNPQDSGAWDEWTIGAKIAVNRENKVDGVIRWQVGRASKKSEFYGQEGYAADEFVDGQFDREALLMRIEGKRVVPVGMETGSYVIELLGDMKNFTIRDVPSGCVGDGSATVEQRIVA